MDRSEIVNLFYKFFCSVRKEIERGVTIDLPFHDTRSLSYWNQSVDLWSKAVYWFLYDRDLRHKRLILLKLKKLLAKKTNYPITDDLTYQEDIFFGPKNKHLKVSCCVKKT